MENFPIKLARELLAKSNACVDLASTGNLIEARSLLDELRFVRHLFAAELADKQRNLDLEKIDDECKSLVAELNNSLEILKKWLSSVRSSFSIDKLLATPEGTEVLLDVNLPLTWSWEEDLVLLSGDLPDQVVHALIERGQKKVIFLKTGRNTDRIKYISAPPETYDSLNAWSTDHIGRSIYIGSSTTDSPPTVSYTHLTLPTILLV